VQNKVGRWGKGHTKLEGELGFSLITDRLKILNFGKFRTSWKDSRLGANNFQGGN